MEAHERDGRTELPMYMDVIPCRPKFGFYPTVRSCTKQALAIFLLETYCWDVELKF
jgi:hypothetical protein